MTSQVKIADERPGRGRWAAFGFLLIASLSVIAWFLAPSVITWLKQKFPGFVQATHTLQPLQLQVAFTVAVFVILALVAALIVTIAAPKKPINVKDKDLVKERADMEAYNRKARKRQRRLNREMRDYVQKNQK